MKKLIACLAVVSIAVIGVFTAYGLGLFVSDGVTGEYRNVPYHATFMPNAFFSGSYVILRSTRDVDNHIGAIMEGFSHDSAPTTQDLQHLRDQVRALYAPFTTTFFNTHTLVVALVDQGSGNVNYALHSLAMHHETLTINVDRNAPMIATMDFVSWVLFLELPNTAFNFTAVQVHLQ